MMNQVVVNVGLVMTLAAAVQGLSMDRFQPDIPTELVKPNFLDTHIHDFRFRRSANDDFAFPGHLLVNVTTDNVTVTLVLTYSHVNGASPPVFEFDENGNVVERVVVINISYAFYQDVNTGASFLVSCSSPAVEDCSLDGSFYYRQQKISMRPHESFASTGLHEVQQSDPTAPIDYGDDIRNNDNILPVNDDNSGSRKKKRALPDGANIVETLAFPDEAIYSTFLAGGNETDAVTAMTLYLGLLFNEIDLHYVSISQINDAISIRVALAGIVIAKNGSTDAPWSYDNTYTIDGGTYLDANWALDDFTNWRNGNYKGGTVSRGSFVVHDHAMGLTGKDLAFIKNRGKTVSSGILAYAFLPGICTNSDTSLTEVVGTKIAQTLAHELGHNLGADHDQSPRCESSRLNVMTAYLSPVLRPDQSAKAQAEWTFSPCSIHQMQANIEGLHSNCLLQHDTITTDALDEPRSLPGEYFTLDQQCQFNGGPMSVSCEDGARVSNTSCYAGFQCGYHGTSCDDTSYPLYPLAGTPCGDSSDSWCYKGRCWPKSFRPTQTTWPITTTGPPCTSDCCKWVLWKNRQYWRCCRGRRCCRRRWGRNLPCCTQCPWVKG